MASLDRFLAHTALTIFVAIAFLAIRDARHTLPGRLCAALSVSAGAQYLAGWAELPEGPALLARALGVANVGLVWWFCLSLLRDDWRPGAAEWLGMAALCLAPLIYFLAWLGLPTPFPDAVSWYGSAAPLVMIAQVAWVAVAERQADLVEPRRRARVWLVVACLAMLVVSLATEELTDPLAASLIRNLMLGPAILFPTFLWLVRLPAERFAFEPLRVAPVVAVTGVDPRDAALHRRLVEAIEGAGAYRTPGLTIDRLAETVRAPVGQVRALIHGGLGYRNFAAFLNAHRLRHVKVLLADPERARDTVLALAHEAGFASLATFNRVFKDAEGVTPTEFRDAALTRPPLKS